uniref:Uncharacterized protein n=1 Tax=Aegilops tauschii subsp. strangulata TaxID=200361 RepID=A0A453LPY3_AEGTS
LSPGSLSPVMIPPPRHVDHLSPDSPSPPASDVLLLASSAPQPSSMRFAAASEFGEEDSRSLAPSAGELGTRPLSDWSNITPHPHQLANSVAIAMK